MDEFDISQFEEVAPEQDSGFDPSQFEELPPHRDGTSPKSALPESPVGLLDRAKLGFGNTRGNVSYLKKQFEDVQVDPDNGIVVKDKGTWKQVDPSALGGDGWEISEALKDMLEGGTSMGFQMAGQTAGAVAGAVAGPAGSIGGAGVGGMAGEGIRTVLGRALGTYEVESEMEMLQDIGIEGLMSMGGQALSLAARPAAQYFRKGIQSLKGAPQATKEIAAATYGAMTGAGNKATLTMIDQIDDFSKEMVKFRKLPEGEAAAQIVRSQIDDVNNLAEIAVKELPKRYGQILDELAEGASKEGKKLSVNIGGMTKKALDALTEQGLGKIDSKTGKFVAFSADDVAKMVPEGQVPELMDKASFRKVAEIAAELNKFSKVGTVEGKTAVKALESINKRLNGLAYSDDPMMGRIGTIANSSFKTSTRESFSKIGLEDLYNSKADLYAKFQNAVTEARKILSTEKPEGLIKRAAKERGEDETAQIVMEKLADLGGDYGKALKNSIDVKESVKRYLPLRPKMGFLQGSAATAGGIGFATGAVSAPLALTLGSQMSPRIGGATLRGATRGVKAVGSAMQPMARYGLEVAEMFKRMPPKSLKQALNHPELIGSAFTQAMQSMQEEDQALMDILNQAGVGQ